MPKYVRQGGVWRDVTSPIVRQGGVWRDVHNGYARVAGVWRDVYTRFTQSGPATGKFITEDDLQGLIELQITHTNGDPNYSQWQILDGYVITGSPAWTVPVQGARFRFRVVTTCWYACKYMFVSGSGLSPTFQNVCPGSNQNEVISCPSPWSSEFTVTNHALNIRLEHYDT